MSGESPPPSAILYPPGGLLVWSLVLMELITFVKMMLVAFRFMNLRHAHPFWKCAVVLVIAAFASTLGLLAFR